MGPNWRCWPVDSQRRHQQQERVPPAQPAVVPSAAGGRFAGRGSACKAGVPAAVGLPAALLTDAAAVHAPASACSGGSAFALLACGCAVAASVAASRPGTPSAGVRLPTSSAVRATRLARCAARFDLPAPSVPAAASLYAAGGLPSRCCPVD